MKLFSGAGHDGQAMAKITDIAMLFVRCHNGLSHHPDEAISIPDADIAARVVLELLKGFKPA